MNKRIGGYRRPAPRPRNKYGARKTIVTEDGTIFDAQQLNQYNIADVTGIKFDSKMEAEYYLLLKKRIDSGEISKVVFQPKFILQDKPRITYRADFQIWHEDGTTEVIDVKGHITKDFRLKQKMFAAVYGDYKLTLVTKKGRRWIER